MAANPKPLIELGMPAELAKVVASQIESGGLQIGTSSTTAMAGDKTPTASERGGVLQNVAIPDLAGGADLATTVTKVNAILAALRTAGVIAS
jgi:hypothetical protein